MKRRDLKTKYNNKGNKRISRQKTRLVAAKKESPGMIAYIMTALKIGR